MRSISTMRWQVFAVLTAIATLSGCSCHASRIAQAKGNPNFINPKADGAFSIADDDGKSAPQGRTITVDFGPTLDGSDKPNTKTLVITNAGVATVQLLHLDKADGFNSDTFKVPAATQIARSIEPGQNTTIDIAFAPDAAGDYTSDFTIATDADETTGHPLTVHLKGQGVANGCVLAPADKLDFGNVRLNTSYSKTLTIQNSTPIDWVFSYTGISGKDAALFATDLSVGDVVVKAHDKLDIAVTFTANHRDIAAAELQFSTPGEMCQPTPFDLRANGVDSLITADPNPLDFGYEDTSVDWNQTGKQVTLTNTGNDALDLASPILCDGVYGGSYNASCTATSEFAAAPDGSRNVDQLTGIHLEGHQTKQLTLYFKPSHLHTAQGSVQFQVQNLPAQTDFGFDLKGVGGGPKIQVQPMHVDFGVVAVGAPQDRNVFVTNVGSSPANVPGAELIVSDITIVPAAGTDPSEFTVDTSALPFSLAATKRQAVPVHFSPTGTGTRSATMKITSNDPSHVTQVTLQADGENLPPCNYTVSPSTLNFGNVAAGRNRVLSFRVTNTGATDCLISSLDLGGDTSTPPYSLVNGAITGQTLAAGASLDVPVKFAPIDAQQTQNGSVTFYTSSTSAPSTTVSLTGGSAQGCILITPDDLDFGVVQQGCASRDRTFTIYNVCSTSQTVTGIDFQPDAAGRCPDQGGTHTCPFRITQAPTLPASIGGGASATFTLKYQPAAVETDSVEVAVTTAQLANPYIVTLAGRGDTTAIQTDTFRQDAQPKVDVLLVVDDSGSMETKQQYLGQNFQSFIQFAVNQQVDYHIGVTTTSAATDPSVDCNTFGGFNSLAPCGKLSPADGSRPRILTSSTPNLEQVFAQNVNVGTYGSGSEMGLEGAYEALSAPNITGWNQGFLRDEANLAVIVVTDTADSSPNTYDFYKNFLLNIKGSRRANAFSFNAVVPTSPTNTPPPTSWSCDYDSEAGTNTRYAQLAQETNGITQEICVDDWATALRQLGQSAFGYRTKFFLTEGVDTSYPIDVQIDGQPYAANGPGGSTRWSYDGSDNSINFAPLAVPEPGSTLTVSYHVLCYPASP